jgi:vitamin-K-epoxide reductase (warfarin-sensitive)
MRYALVVLAVLGILLSGLALREHYRTDASPCAINAKWDCGAVNKSEFAVFFGVPVAAVGMVGYLLMAALAFWRATALLAWAAGFGLGYSLYLTHIEAHILEMWCLYCVGSLIVISLMNVLTLGTALLEWIRPAVISYPSHVPGEQVTTRS